MPKETLMHSISLEKAIELTTRYRQNRPENFPICETFEKAPVIAMLNHPDAVKLRIYMGEKENGKVVTVLCAANELGEDILPLQLLGQQENEGDGLILDDAFRCPEACPPPSPLNTP